MKREILFRAKRSYDKKWMLGNLIIDNEGEKHILPLDWIEQCGHHLLIDSDEPLFFDQDTFGQFTGLTDKNGVKIFEGDIIESDGRIYKIRDFDDLIEFYYWHRECVILEDYTTVVGNIHDI